jgi:hypothetical protein
LERGIERGTVDTCLTARNQADDPVTNATDPARGDDDGRSGEEGRHQDQQDG